jgi:mxaA protein
LVLSAVAASPTVVEQPRPTGYFVGDLLTQRVLLQSAAGNLNPTVLPTPGRVSAWFERRKVGLEKDSSSRPWLVVQYQILNAPQKLTIVTLPAWTLAVQGPAGATTLPLKIPSSHVSVAPLSLPGSPTQVGTADLRPDRLAPTIPLAPIRRQIALSGGALALILASWLVWLLWRNRRAVATQPFASALREMRSLKDREPRAWQVLHRAFDRTAGRVIQTATLPELFERAPQLLPAREEIERFFARSSLLFFGAPAQPATPGPGADVSPRTLCEALRRIERRYER